MERIVHVFAGNYIMSEIRDTQREAVAYAEGVMQGAACAQEPGPFIPVPVGAYVMPEDEAEMREQEDPAEVEKALQAYPHT